MNERAWKVLLVVALMAGFMIRGPWRAYKTNFYDFREVYAASRTFWHHQNPYSQIDILRFTTVKFDFKNTPSVYPPTAFVLWLPFAVLSWRISMMAWLAIHILAFGALLRVMQLGFWQVAFVLLFAPMHSAFAQAQPTLTAFLLIGFAIFAADRARDATAGTLIAAALCIKPQLAVAVVAYYMLVQRWRIILFSVGLFILVAGFSVIWLSPLHWIRDWQVNLASAQIPGGFNDPGRANPFSYQLICLSVTLNRLHLPQILSPLITLSLVIASLKPMIRMRPADAAGLALALSLLPVYHRFYDAIFLLILILPAIAQRRYRMILVGAMFLFPPALWRVIGLSLGPSLATLAVAVLAVSAAIWNWRVGESANVN